MEYLKKDITSYTRVKLSLQRQRLFIAWSIVMQAPFKNADTWTEYIFNAENLFLNVKEML